MVSRPAWTEILERTWARRSLLWLVGVRRVGKTFLRRSLADLEYFDCELPSTRARMSDPEDFLRRVRGRRIVLDEIHRLDNPTELLKVAADHFPQTRVLASGSSVLGASRKFRDSLAGRKLEVWLTPLLVSELGAFGRPDLDRRMLRGGLPALFLADEMPQAEFQEWMDSYWAKDVAELFRLEKRQGFQRLVELLLARSGGIFEATWFARACQLSRQTIVNYLAVLEDTLVAHVVRPYSTHRATEITSAPKVYGFDTGFVRHHRGWDRLRREDRGSLWEHLVLNEIRGRLQIRDVRYWRDKAGHEVDFVLAPPGRPAMAIGCKSIADDFDPAGIQAFRRAYPDGPNLVVVPGVERDFGRGHGEARVTFVGLDSLTGKICDLVARRTPHVRKE